VTDTLQQNRYDQLLRRVGGIIGPGSKVGSVVTDLFPMIDVENVPAELYALMGTKMGWGGANQAAFAGLVNRVQLFNPAGSGLLVTVTRMDITSATGQNIAMGLVDTELTNVPSEQLRDGRQFASPLPAAQLRIDTIAGAAPLNWRSQLLGGRPFTILDKQGIAVLSPGTGLQLSAIAQNTNLITGWMWRERPAEQSELTL